MRSVHASSLAVRGSLVPGVSPSSKIHSSASLQTFDRGSNQCLLLKSPSLAKGLLITAFLYLASWKLPSWSAFENSLRSQQCSHLNRRDCEEDVHALHPPTYMLILQVVLTSVYPTICLPQERGFLLLFKTSIWFRVWVTEWKHHSLHYAGEEANGSL